MNIHKRETACIFLNVEGLEMMVIKRKQIVVLALVIMIVIAGYPQYSHRKGDITASKDDDKGSG